MAHASFMTNSARVSGAGTTSAKLAFQAPKAASIKRCQRKGARRVCGTGGRLGARAGHSPGMLCRGVDQQLAALTQSSEPSTDKAAGPDDVHRGEEAAH